MPSTSATPRPRTIVVLAALVVGIAIGTWVAGSGLDGLKRAIGGIEVLGTMWINAIRMTVIPLVAALTISSVASAPDPRRLGRIGAWAIPTMVALLLVSGAFAMLVAPLSLDRLTITPEVAASLRSSASSAASGVAPAMPSLAQRIVDMVPVNPLKAAADGAILPVVVFSLTLGLALTRLGGEKRQPMIDLCRATSDALLILVGWILAVAPVGVFALALGLGLKMGASSAGALFNYVITMAETLFAFTLFLYPIAVWVGRVPLRKFIAAALPAQAVAFSARSSLAALPAMITGARDTLGLGPTATGFTLPLAVSVFRLNVPIAWVVGFIFLGKLYGIPVSEGALAMLVVTSTLISFSVPGIPSASLFLMAPVLVEYGIPAEGVGILIAIDAIPDMFKTLCNATSHMTAAVVLARVEGATSSPAGP